MQQQETFTGISLSTNLCMCRSQQPNHLLYAHATYLAASQAQCNTLHPSVSSYTWLGFTRAHQPGQGVRDGQKPGAVVRVLLCCVLLAHPIRVGQTPVAAIRSQRRGQLHCLLCQILNCPARHMHMCAMNLPNCHAWLCFAASETQVSMSCTRHRQIGVISAKQCCVKENAGEIGGSGE